MTTVFINLLALGALISSVFSITFKNSVISVIFLIATFVQAAGYLLFLGIQFIGISYIIIYVGAIAVLFLFVIMMININISEIVDTGEQYTKNLLLSIIIAFISIFMFYSIIPENITNFNLPIFFELESLYSNVLNVFDKLYLEVSLLINNIDSILFITYLSLKTVFKEGGYTTTELLSYLLDSFYVLNSYTTQSSIYVDNNLLIDSLPYIISKMNLLNPDEMLVELIQIEGVGLSLYTFGSILLIHLSVILLLAMFATIIISK